MRSFWLGVSSVLRVGSLALAFAVLAAACSDDVQGPSSDPQPPPASYLPPEIVAWLRSHARPFATAQPGGGSEDLEFLRDVIGDARIVALGEATHGTRDFFQMKHRILEFLVEEMGFNTFAIEATWPEANRVNDFVHTGRGDPVVLLSGLYFWTVATEEVRDMILWMRDHNRDPGSGPTVSFYGFDMQYPGMAIHNVLTYLEAVDAGAVPRASDAYACLLPFSNGPDGSFAAPPDAYATMSAGYRDACLDALREVHALLLERREAYEAASSAPAFAKAVRSARLAVQFEELQSQRIQPAAALRDRFMAENVLWLLEQAGPDAKIVLWAHNGHVADDPYYGGGGSMGHHLRAACGDDMVIAGFDFYMGEFQAVTRTDAGTLAGLNVQWVEPPPGDSYEHYFRAPGIERFALDLRGVPLDTPATSWLAGPRPMRFIGASFNRNLQQFSFQSVSLPRRFDLVFYFENTEAARGLYRRFPDSW